MIRIQLQPSRALAGLLISLHAIAALAPWFSAASTMFCLVVTTLVGASLCWQMRGHYRNISALEIRGTECLAEDGRRSAELIFLGRAYCAPSLQILYFKKAPLSGWQRLLPPVSVLVLPDSCSAEAQRCVRQFLRWRCL